MNDICQHCGHELSEHAAGFFNPCLTCGKDAEGNNICPDFEAEDEDEDEEDE